MKIVFAGTPEFAVPSLRALCEAGFCVAAVLTQPDKPQGRKGILTPSPVKKAARELGIPVLQPMRLKEDFTCLRTVGADLMVTCAYGQILTQETLDLFPRGVWNVHASLLPAYRGAAPIARVIMDGCKKTGVTIMKTDAGLDTGDIFLSEELPIEESDTCGSLTGKLSLLGARLIVQAVKEIDRGGVQLKKQGEGTVCKKVARTQVDFSCSAKEVSALIRALSPAPLAYANVAGLTLNFYNAIAENGQDGVAFGTVLTDSPKEGFLVQCGKGVVRILEVQAAGGKKMSAKDFLNGRKIQKGQRFEESVL